jgi:prophage maintenance system killer protein
VYPSLLEKAAILLERLARNHPLRRATSARHFVLTTDFLKANGRLLRGGEPDGDVAVVEQIAAGQIEHQQIVAWLERRTRGAED